MIGVQLEAQQWNVVLAILARAPWQEANPLIMAIAEQVRQANAGPPVVTGRPNGADEGEGSLRPPEGRQRPS